METDVSFGVDKACVQRPECSDEGFGIHFTVNWVQKGMGGDDSSF